MTDLELAELAQSFLPKSYLLCFAFARALGIETSESNESPHAVFTYINKELNNGSVFPVITTLAEWLEMRQHLCDDDINAVVKVLRELWLKEIIAALKAGETYESLAAKADGSTLLRIVRGN